MKRQIILFSSLIIIPLLISACKNQSQMKFPPAQVKSFQVISGKASYYNDYPASVVALNQVELRPEVSGYISGIDFKDGQIVKKGMKLYTIDQQQYKAAYEKAIADLNVAKANLLKAQEDAERYSQLAQKDAVARQIYEHSKTDLEAAKMQVSSSEENVKQVQTNLLYSVIKAPFDGTIGISSVKLGSSVISGQTLLNTISSNDPVAVDFSVDENQIQQFSELLTKKLKNNDSTFTLILPDNSVYPYNGRISLMDRAVDPLTGTITIRLIFPNPKDMLRPGLTCNVRVLQNNDSNSILIPFEAVTEQMGEYSVFKIIDGKAHQQRIEIGRTIKNMVIVKSGLNVGDNIITQGFQTLRDNSPVIVIPSTPKPNIKK